MVLVLCVATLTGSRKRAKNTALRDVLANKICPLENFNPAAVKPDCFQRRQGYHGPQEAFAQSCIRTLALNHLKREAEDDSNNSLLRSNGKQ